jgi:hypothetical protein
VSTRHRRTAVLLLTMTLGGGSALALPAAATQTRAVANDEIGAATVIGSLPFGTAQSVAEATKAADDPGLPCAPGQSPKWRSVWFRYTPATAQNLKAHTGGSDYDTLLAVWTGSPGSLTNVACSDDAIGLQSYAEFAVAAGTTYYFEVASVYENPGGTQMYLSVQLRPGPFGKASPADGAAGQAQNPVLTWEAAEGTDFYEYCYDTSDDDACATWVDAGTAKSAALSGLAEDTAYYWQVRAGNGDGRAYADGSAAAFWSFRTRDLQEMTFQSQSLYDGWVLEQVEDSGKGGTFDAGAATARLGDDALDRQYRAILDFDTAGLPDDAVITAVTLRIKKQGITGTNPFTTHGLLLVDMKTGFYHEIRALEKYDFQAVGSRGNVGRFIKTPSGGWYRAPLRARNYGLVNVTGITQFRLRFEIVDDDDGAADFLSFYTGDTGIPANRPELVVTYYVP